MRSPVDLAVAILSVLSSIAPRAQDTAPAHNVPPKGYVALFDGKSIDGWWGMSTEDPRPLLAMTPAQRDEKVRKSLADIRAHWSVENGELVNDGNGLYLTTRNDYADFELLVDYRTVAKADSGIYLRGIPQVQIWDSTEAGGKWNIGADKGSGGLWNNSAGAVGKDPLVHADRPFGEWNRFRIKMVGSYVTVHLNERLVVEDAVMENYFDRTMPVPRTGPIQLQTHGGEIRWRNVFLREIGAEEANAYLRSLGDDGYAPVFNGRDFDGWAGPPANYAIAEGGVLMCKPHEGGTIFTKQEYGDFAVDLEIKFPPGGNNGLAIRYPGDGDAAYAAMCELQVLENSDPKYAKLDPRQFHGSAYGMVGAQRGFHRAIGEWNHQRVVVRGSTIQVELNGFRILDCDLAKVTEFMAGSAHPGKDRKRGHFGFAGHSDPVQFRNVRIKPLD